MTLKAMSNYCWTALLPLASLVTAVTIAISGCGSSTSTSTATQPTVTSLSTGPGVSNSEVKYLFDYMSDWYLWYDRIPTADLSKYTTSEQALTVLKVPEDRYSFIDSAASFNAFFDEGKTIGYGIGLSQIGSESLFLRLVQPDSNAAAQGLKRGDQIVAIDDVPVATLISENRLDAALGPAQVGVQARFRLARDAQGPVITVVKSSYPIRYVLAPQIIDNAGRKTGYIYFFSFGNIGRDAWLNELQKLLDAGAQDLVVDLRDNGGGLLSVANDLESSLAVAGVVGQTSMRLEFNNKHTGANSTYTFANSALAGRLDRFAWITSPRTCSASESLISALLPYRTSARVGETTCGKPVGFTPPEFNGKVYNIVTFRSLNHDGFTDYFNGLAPTCAAGDDFSRPLGDSAEPRLATALSLLRNEPCPPATKSLSRETILESGFERVTGLR